MIEEEARAWAEAVVASNRNSSIQKSTSVRRLLDEVQECEDLAEILGRYNPQPHSSYYQQLYETEYLPLYEYLRQQLVATLRKDLKRAAYPTPKGCFELLQEADDQASSSQKGDIVDTCQALYRLKRMHEELVRHTVGASVVTPTADHVLMELCRPFVERLQFHFVQESQDRPTTTRIDRLVEWLLQYLREQIFEVSPDEQGKHGDAASAAPWEWIAYGLAPRLQSTSFLAWDFLNEVVRMIQWVLGERNFFRHERIAGARSNPALLVHAIEHLLLFDDETARRCQGLVVVDSNNKSPRRRVLSLVDVFIAGDEELLGWWLERERHAVLFTLFDDDDDDDITTSSNNKNSTLPQRLTHRVSPRAELFCALMHSMATKARVFHFSGPYLQQVAVSACMQFLDAIHESATDLRNELKRKRSTTKNPLLSDRDLQHNFERWVELINGTHMAALVLSMSSSSSSREGANVDTAITTDEEEEEDFFSSSTSSTPRTGDQDLDRFGRSLQGLENVLIEDFATTVVETLLMERAKLAAYLMRCSHLLTTSSADNGTLGLEDQAVPDPSPDLVTTLRVLDILQSVCHVDEDENDEEDGGAFCTHQTCQFAPRRMQTQVWNALAEKFLDVALNLDGMTPDLYPAGCVRFARDVQYILKRHEQPVQRGVEDPPSQPPLPRMALRLSDVAHMMCLERPVLAGLGDALCGLAGQMAPLGIHVFEEDHRLAEEAISMIRAKGGCMWMELSDVLDVLNRRRDLLPVPTL